MHDFKYENNKIVHVHNVKNINVYHPRAHFVVIHNDSSVFTL